MLKLGLNMQAKDVVKYWLSLLLMQCLRPRSRKGHVFFAHRDHLRLHCNRHYLVFSQKYLAFVFYLLGLVWAMLRNVGLSICKKHPWLERITTQNHGVWLCTLQTLRVLSKIMVVCNWMESYSWNPSTSKYMMWFILLGAKLMLPILL